MALFLLLVFLFPQAQAQFGLFPGFGFPQPPPPPNPWANLFSNPFQPFQQLQTTIPPTTTQPPIESVPNPDLERGNFPSPNPRMWPIGPDWNDPRNTWTSELGWGGRDVGRVTTESSTRTTPFISTTAVPLDSSAHPEISNENDLLVAASSTQASPIIRPFSQLMPNVKEGKKVKEVEFEVNATKTPKILGEDSISLSQMTSRQLESDRLVRHRSTSHRRH